MITGGAVVAICLHAAGLEIYAAIRRGENVASEFFDQTLITVYDPIAAFAPGFREETFFPFTARFEKRSYWFRSGTSWRTPLFFYWADILD